MCLTDRWDSNWRSAGLIPGALKKPEFGPRTDSHHDSNNNEEGSIHQFIFHRNPNSLPYSAIAVKLDFPKKKIHWQQQSQSYHIMVNHCIYMILYIDIGSMSKACCGLSLSVSTGNFALLGQNDDNVPKSITPMEMKF